MDDDCPAKYECNNYDSILVDNFKAQMHVTIVKELSTGRVTKVNYKPRCVHSLGTVEKSNGKLWLITDTKTINNCMETTFRHFKYNSVNDVVNMLMPADMCVVEISSAKGTVNVASYFLDNRLCFGLRQAPNIFTSISDPSFAQN